MTTAALTIQAIGRLFKEIAATWTTRRSAGSSLSALGSLSEEQLRQFDHQLGGRTNDKPLTFSVMSEPGAKSSSLAEQSAASRVLPFAPLPLRHGALSKKSASVLP